MCKPFLSEKRNCKQNITKERQLIGDKIVTEEWIKESKKWEDRKRRDEMEKRMQLGLVKMESVQRLERDR